MTICIYCSLWCLGLPIKVVNLNVNGNNISVLYQLSSLTQMIRTIQKIIIKQILTVSS